MKVFINESGVQTDIRKRLVGNKLEQKTIKEIEQLLMSEDAEEWMNALKHDPRQGVKKLLDRYEKRKAHENQLFEQFQEMLQYEMKVREQGVTYIAGIDEVGRGPLAGPVVCAAVILPESFYLPGLTDSKKLSKQKREYFFEMIEKEAIACSVSMIHADEIDTLNIYEATKKAMCQAVHLLKKQPQHLLIDAMKLPIPIEQTSIIKGDQKSISIAASSIIAKVTRDKYMEQVAKRYPQYGFDSHMGYGTKEHLEAIERYGIIEEHRKSFRPISEM